MHIKKNTSNSFKRIFFLFLFFNFLLNSFNVIAADWSCPDSINGILKPSNVIKPAGYVENLSKKPIYRDGHTLPRLFNGFSSGGGISGASADLIIELAKNWNYAMPVYSSNKNTLDQKLADTTSYDYKIFEKNRENPKKYPLSHSIERYVATSAEYPSYSFVQDIKGRLQYYDNKKIFSPIMPMVMLRKNASERTDFLRHIAAIGRVSTIYHGGENELGVPGYTSITKDPLAKAYQGETTHNQFFSERKAAQEIINTNEIRSTVPGRQIYNYYFISGGRNRNYGFWDSYIVSDYDKGRGVLDYPSDTIYYKFNNSGYASMLEQNIAAMAEEKRLGQPLSYQWVNNGWGNSAATNSPGASLGDHSRYIGYLKSLYMLGNIGGAAGYFSLPLVSAEGYNGFDSCLDPNLPFDFSRHTESQPYSIPHWLTQALSLSQVQAEFSYLEPFIRNGEILPGPLKNGYNYDAPGYRFNTENNDTFVLVRKLNNQNFWLISAYSADGINRTVSVSIPGIGSISVNSVAEGHLYLYDGTLHLLDGNNPDTPSVDLANEYSRESHGLFNFLYN